jgi:hypothetical protein
LRQTFLIMLGACLLLVAGCGGGSSSGETPARPASPTTYPDLASVPARPVLTDTQQQRTELQHQLATAGQAADRRAAELAYETGRGPEPPPLPAPPPAAAPGLPRPSTEGAGVIARAYLDSSLTELRDRGKLRQFMRRLAREAPDPAGPRTVVQALGLVATPEAGAPAAVAQPAEPRAPNPLDRFGNFDDDAFNPYR